MIFIFVSALFFIYLLCTLWGEGNGKGIFIRTNPHALNFMLVLVNAILVLNAFPFSSFLLLFIGMSHEPKSPSLGMISTATRTTATVSPLTPSPLNGSIVANGSPAAQSTHSGFAAALRKLAKQAEEPRGKATRPVTDATLN